MCMEDIRIGRKTSAKGQSVSVDAGGTLLFPRSPKRIALTLSGNLVANDLFIFYGDSMAAPLVAYLNSTSPNFSLTLQDHGVLVHGPFFVAATGATNVGMTETFLDRE